MANRVREITDQNKIDEILNDCSYLHLGLSNENGQPYVVPMNYGVTKDSSDDHYIIYLHSGHSGRKLDIIRENPKCCFTMERNVAPFEGRMACQFGMTYESIIGTGKISFVDDVDEKIQSLKILMKTQTGSDDYNFDERMVSIVTVMRIDVESISGRFRPLPETLQD